jgi:acyl transferase domain-containing protein
MDIRDPIAIIGIGCRFPGADGPNAYWNLLKEGVDAVTEIPRDRWDVEAFYDPKPGTPGKMYTRCGGFLKDIDQFDPIFFRIMPREAAQMDPQQRILLEVAWEALENAGVSPEQLAGSSASVYVGISTTDYNDLQANHFASMDSYFGTGNAHSIAANRISYLLDLRGPSETIDTACSSSLVTIHTACRSLAEGESNLALAGGVNLIISPKNTIVFSQARMMSPEGRCKTFDAAANGYVRGEGCGIIVLKRLSDALKDGDNVLAVIRGSAVNQDGHSNGLTAPNGPAQQEVIFRALKNAGVEPNQVGYVEAHGTGTSLGDTIEIQALSAVFGGNGADSQPCAVGSCKTNFGHLEAAAGIASLIKVVLSLQNGEIPPHLHLKKLNPHFSLEKTRIIIPTTRTPWPSGERARFAGVSSFGFGGTNAHVILQEAPQKSAVRHESERPPHLLTLSARTEGALKDLVKRFENHLETHKCDSLADICFTANTGRSHFEHRLAIIAGSLAELRDMLHAYGVSKEISGLFHGTAHMGQKNKAQESISWERREKNSEHFLHELGASYVRGNLIDWKRFYQDQQFRRIPLPTYPFQRQRFWFETTN